MTLWSSSCKRCSVVAKVSIALMMQTLLFCFPADHPALEIKYQAHIEQDCLSHLPTSAAKYKLRMFSPIGPFFHKHSIICHRHCTALSENFKSSSRCRVGGEGMGTEAQAEPCPGAVLECACWCHCCSAFAGASPHAFEGNEFYIFDVSPSTEIFRS